MYAYMDTHIYIYTLKILWCQIFAGWRNSYNYRRCLGLSSFPEIFAVWRSHQCPMCPKLLGFHQHIFWVNHGQKNGRCYYNTKQSGLNVANWKAAGMM